jgi:hypothetical protein
MSARDGLSFRAPQPAALFSCSLPQRHSFSEEDPLRTAPLMNVAVLRAIIRRIPELVKAGF